MTTSSLFCIIFLYALKDTKMKKIFNRFKHIIKHEKLTFFSLLAALILLMLSFFVFKSYYDLKQDQAQRAIIERKAEKARRMGICSFVPVYKTKTIKYQKYIPNITQDDVDKHQKKEESRITKLKKKNKKKIVFGADCPFKIMVNRTENFVTIMGINKKGEYTIPYKTFICSTAENEKDTPIGEFHLNDRYRWHQMVDGSYAQYAIRIYGGFMLHSIPYYEQKANSLETEEYNKLGSKASLGCVRMRIKDIKWVYDNCQAGTEIEVYDKKGEEPVYPLPKINKLKLKGKKSKWDPTDTHKKNPWK